MTEGCPNINPQSFACGKIQLLSKGALGKQIYCNLIFKNVHGEVLKDIKTPPLINLNIQLHLNKGGIGCSVTLLIPARP